MRRGGWALVRSITAAVAATGSIVVWLSLPTAAAPAAAGARLWHQQYAAPTLGFDDFGRAVAFSPDGTRVYSTGDSAPAVATVAYDAATGQRLWVARLDGAVGFGALPVGVAVSPDGTRVYVAGSINMGSSIQSQDYLAIAYDAASGARLWTRIYDGTGHDRDTASGMSMSPDGSTLFVTGQSWGRYGVGTKMNATTVAYDTAAGATKWVARYPSIGSTAADVAVSSDGNRVVVTGRGATPSGFVDEFLTVSYDAATGAKQWSSFYLDPGFSSASAEHVSFAPDGSSVFVSGVLGYSNTLGVVAYQADTGAGRWATRINRASGTSPFVTGSVVAPDGSTLYLSEGDFSASADVRADALDTLNGSLRWSSRYDGPFGGNDSAYGLALDPAGGMVYVAGYESLPGYAFAAVTMALDAVTGQRTWVRLFSGVASSPSAFAMAVAVSPDGSEVVITGEDSDDAGYDHRCTVAYATA